MSSRWATIFSPSSPVQGDALPTPPPGRAEAAWTEWSVRHNRRALVVAAVLVLTFHPLFLGLDRFVVPALMHWQHPRFFAYFPASASAPSILGELLAAGLGVQGMLWATSPACTELETRVLDWLRSLLGLPDRFAGHRDLCRSAPLR